MTSKTTSKKRHTRGIAVSSKGIARGRKNLLDAAGFEQLEKRELMSTVNVATFGAKTNDGGDDRAAIQAAINAAKPGDSVVFNDGTYTINGQIEIKSGITMTGVTDKGATLDFTVPINDGTPNQANFAIHGGDISSFGFTNLKVRSNNGNYYNRLAFFTPSGANGLVINNNYFHDSETSDRNLEVWGWSNGSYSHNTFYKINDGGHIMVPGDNFHMDYNTGTLIHRMGIEIQQTTWPVVNPPSGMTVIGNVFYDWNKPYWDSMGMSIPIATNGIKVQNNYIRQNAYNGVWGEADGSGNVRGSYGIEAPITGGDVSGNVIGGERDVVGISTPGVNTNVHDNTFFGTFSWGLVIGEPGPYGEGSPSGSNNTLNSNLSAMAAPSVPDGTTTSTPDVDDNSGSSGGSDSGTTDPVAPTKAAITSVKATALSSTSVQLTWKVAKGVTAGRIDVVSTVGRQIFNSVTVDASTGTVVLNGLHQGWELDFIVNGQTASGWSAASPVTVQMTGDSGAAPAAAIEAGSVPSSATKKKRYLDRMTPSFVRNQSGSVEKDQSNGGSDDNDGSEITIKGRKFERGLGVTAHSKLVYNLNGKYSTFSSFIGLDDDAEVKGTVKFEVYGDGKLLYESDDVNTSSKARKVKVNVAGVKKLWLVVTDSDGGKSVDTQADWAQSYLMAA